MLENTEEKIRVLIVDDIPETRENLRKLLYFEKDIEVVGAATSGREGIEMARQYQPDIVLMDINMPDMDGITASEIIVQESPYTQVVMMSVQSEADYLRRSMLAGARDFLTKPFTSDELISTIRRVYEMGKTRRPPVPPPTPTGPLPTAPVTYGPPPTLGKVIAVFSPKGGTGCSVIAVNLAIALQRITEEKKVALVDASLQFGDVAVLLNLQASRSIADLVGQIDSMDQELIEATMLPHGSGIRVLLAPPRPEMADLVTPDHLSTILNELRKTFDYIIVDTWTSLHDLVLSVLDNAHRIILIATPDIPALKNVKLFFEVAEALEYPPDKTLLVLNRMDRRSGITARDIEESIKHPIAAQIPCDDRVVLLSVNQGVPFVLSDRGRPVAQGIFELARKLMSSLEEAKEASPAEAAERVGQRLGRLFR